MSAILSNLQVKQLIFEFQGFRGSHYPILTDTAPCPKHRWESATVKLTSQHYLQTQVACM